MLPALGEAVLSGRHHTQSSSALLSGKGSPYMGCLCLSFVVTAPVGVLVAEVGCKPGWPEILLCAVAVSPLRAPAGFHAVDCTAW